MTTGSISLRYGGVDNLASYSSTRAATASSTRSRVLSTTSIEEDKRNNGALLHNKSTDLLRQHWESKRQQRNKNLQEVYRFRDERIEVLSPSPAHLLWKKSMENTLWNRIQQVEDIPKRQAWKPPTRHERRLTGKERMEIWQEEERLRLECWDAICERDPTLCEEERDNLGAAEGGASSAREDEDLHHNMDTRIEDPDPSVSLRDDVDAQWAASVLAKRVISPEQDDSNIGSPAHPSGPKQGSKKKKGTKTGKRKGSAKKGNKRSKSLAALEPEGADRQLSKEIEVGNEADNRSTSREQGLVQPREEVAQRERESESIPGTTDHVVLAGDTALEQDESARATQGIKEQDGAAVVVEKGPVADKPGAPPLVQEDEGQVEEESSHPVVEVAPSESRDGADGVAASQEQVEKNHQQVENDKEGEKNSTSTSMVPAQEQGNSRTKADEKQQQTSSTIIQLNEASLLSPPPSPLVPVPFVCSPVGGLKVIGTDGQQLLPTEEEYLSSVVPTPTDCEHRLDLMDELHRKRLRASIIKEDSKRAASSGSGGQRGGVGSELSKVSEDVPPEIVELERRLDSALPLSSPSPPLPLCESPGGAGGTIGAVVPIQVSTTRREPSSENLALLLPDGKVEGSTTGFLSASSSSTRRHRSRQDHVLLPPITKSMELDLDYHGGNLVHETQSRRTSRPGTTGDSFPYRRSRDLFQSMEMESKLARARAFQHTTSSRHARASQVYASGMYGGGTKNLRFPITEIGGIGSHDRLRSKYRM
ncbi:unnamed protein product [Amoebophrya sp. A25]|nr:unnamed protein product [Amoebophrya sp. A25]|eukprot:GSA25T00020197001.1